VQRDLFADPQLEYRKAVQFYQHDVDWANRIILGDSLSSDGEPCAARNPGRQSPDLSETKE